MVCPICGQKVGFFQKSLNCYDCKTVVHRDCYSNWVGLCPNCIKNRENYYLQNINNIFDNSCPFCYQKNLIDVRIVYNPKYGNSIIPSLDDLDDPYNYEFPEPSEYKRYWVCQNCKNGSENLEYYFEALKQEECGNYEEAANCYHKLSPFFSKKEKELRDNNRTITNKQISVDINLLLEQVKNGNLAIPYKCRNCGASIKIDKQTTKENLCYCAYCGSAMKLIEIEDFLKNVL
jgi:DNA-directed RNA polymerase subunit RPC12/RpoP